jgi:hypothetical protein
MRSFTPVLHHSNIERSEAWLISSMCHVPSVTTNSWLARNFFVCRRLTVIVLIAAMNFRSALPPAKRPKRRINAADHDTASSQGISRNEIPLYPPFSKGEETQCVSGFASAEQIPLFEKEGLGEICVRNATESSQRDRLRRKGNFASHLGGIHVNHYVSKETKAP